MKKDDARQAEEIADRYLAAINRRADLKPVEAMAQGVIRGALRAAITEAVALGRTSMHDDMIADHRA